MSNIFTENIKEYDLLDLVNWIKRCRSYVKESDKWKSGNKNPEEYKEMVLNFIAEWENHYKENEKFYESELYKKAILGAGLPEDIVNIKNEKGESISYPAETFFNKLGVKTELSYKDKLKKQLEDYYNWFDIEIDKLNKNNYRVEICNMIKYKNEIYEYDFYIDDEDILREDIDIIINKLKDKDIDKTMKKFKKLPYSKKDPMHINGLLETLYAWDIAKQQYYNYKNVYTTKNVNGKKIKVTIEIQKKFIINLGLYFSLDLDHFEKLAQIHGYSVKNSFEERDILLSHLLKLGVSKEYIDIAFENRNFSDLKKRDCFDDRDFYFNTLMKYIDKIKKEKVVYSKDDVKKILSEDEYKEYEKVRKAVLEKVENYIQKLDKKINQLEVKIAKNHNKVDEEKLDELKNKTHMFESVLNINRPVKNKDVEEDEDDLKKTPLRTFKPNYNELKSFLNQIKEA